MAGFEAPRRFRGLTKAQKREQEAAIYGFQESNLAQNAPNLTHEEVEKMRQLVMAHDATKQGGIKEFDLNDPPRKPYFYQEFPRMMYHHATGRNRVANNADEMAQALKAGWVKEPPAPELAEEPAFDSGFDVQAGEEAEPEQPQRRAKKSKE